MPHHVWQSTKSTARILFILVSTIVFTQVLSAQETGGDSPITGAAHHIVGIDGEAHIHRASWGDPFAFEPLVLGDSIGSHDIIEPRNGAVVQILCYEGTISEVRSLAATATCQPLPDNDPTTVILRGGSQVMTVVAQLLYPRGMIMSDQPRLVWRRVEQAISYRVRITPDNASDPILEASNLSQTSLDYPADQKPLPAGNYVVVIEPISLSGLVLDELKTSSHVIVVSPQITTFVQEELTRRDLGFKAPEITAYIKAVFLADQGFYSEAIETLQPVLSGAVLSSEQTLAPLPSPTTLEGSPRPYLYLGYWYSRIQLFDYAEGSFNAALKLASAYHQRESIALASAALGQLRADLRSQYCAYKLAEDFFTVVDDRSAQAEHVAQQMSGIINILQYEPTCLETNN